jgi:hypothetical protein
LYRRCKEWRTLPRKGGLFDQDEKLLELFDVISEEVDFWKRKQQQEQEGDMLSEKMMAGRMYGRC